MNNFQYRRKKRNNIPLFIVLAVAVFGIVYVYISTNFERVAPKIEIENTIYWNLKQPISFKIKDNSGLGSYKISLIQENNEIVIDEKKVLLDKPKELSLDLRYPENRMISTNLKTTLMIEATDISMWNFLSGNSANKKVNIVIDKKRPFVNIISKSYAFRKGGAALVVFEAKDDNLGDLYLQSSEGRKFKASKFVKENFYISLIANDFRDSDYKMYIYAEDKAKNLTKTYIPFYYKDRNYKNSKIKISDKFLDGKIEQLFYEHSHELNANNNAIERLDKFKFINEDLREANYKFIAKHTTDVPEIMDNDFFIKPFIPLINSAKVGSFGDHRYYHYDGKTISESYHMGIDFASVQNDKIILSNAGTVKYTGYNGIYGNMAVISHGLGLYTIYAHCSNITASEGAQLRENETLGETGTTGLALGDHLHFGILIQGIEVRPEEWLDTNWIKANITNIINDAKKIIGEI